jgi:hypothetical protein
MTIIKGTEPITVDHPVILLFGQPGICKSSLGYSAKDPLLLDFDKGAHRAANRRDTLVINSWTDVKELMESADQLDPYGTLTVDTVGRCLDVMTAHIAATDPKKAPGGNLSQQGWGVLKTNFRTWIANLRTKGKDVLLIAHDKEDKDGDTRIVRPDIVGGSYGEVMKVADFVGYVYMNGRDRVLDFNPTDRWIGKNPGGWAPFPVPPIGKAQSFMAELFDKGREALGAISEESAQITQQVDTWRANIAKLTTPKQLNEQMPIIKAIVTPIVQAQAAKLLMDRGAELKLSFDKDAKKFSAPKEEKQPEQEAVGAN